MPRLLRRLMIAVSTILLIPAVALMPETAYAESNGGVRVMPLGDSITDGSNVPGGYRIGLWQRLVSGGNAADLVGSQFNGPAGLGDHDHEGHPGWRIDELDAHIVDWLHTSNPHTVLLHIGTNDIGQNTDLPNAPARLGKLVDHILASQPGAHVFVAQITPVEDPTREARTRTFNAALPAVVQSKGPNVHLVDMHSALTTADLADGTHPNVTGYDKMAAVWYSALKSVPESLGGAITGIAGLCVDVRQRSTADGTPIQTYTCNQTPAQSWTRTPDNRLVALGKCMDIAQGGTTDFTKIQLYTCNNTGAQEWVPQSNGALLNPRSGKCLDVNQASRNPGTQLQIYTCNNTDAQKWTLP